MATVNKNFKIKSGLIVEGTTGTINGEDILTKAQADIDYIIGEVGGSGVSTNTPDTLVLRDNAGSFAAQEVTVEVLNVSGIGTISDDGELLVAAATGEDIRLSADDVRVDAVDDFRVNVGGDILLATTGVGNNVYVGSIDTGNEVVTELTLDNHIGDVTVDGTAGNTVTDRISTAATNAQNTATSYTDTRETAITAAYEAYADQAELDAVVTAAADATTKADQAEADAISAAALDATTKADAAEAAAKLYADGLAVNYDAAGAADAALVDAKAYTDAEVAALVDGAPALLDTLNELAAAIADNPNYATDVANLVASKADTTYVDDEIAAAIQSTTYTAGTNIDITGNVVSVTGLDSADISDFSTAAVSANTGLWDTIGAAATAEANAKSYADGLAVNYDAAGAAATAEANANDYTDTVVGNLTTNDIEEGDNMYFTDARATNAAGVLLQNASKTNISISYDSQTQSLTVEAENGVADSTTDDLAEGGNNLYFTDERAIDAVSGVVIYPESVIFNNLAKQVAATATVVNAGTVAAYSWAKADYRTAKFLVKTAYGTHTDVAEVLLTLDTSDNIAITEYAMVGTNGSAMTISADINGTNVELNVTTANNNSTVTVVGTLLA
jgi:hypothetical protein